MDSQLAKASKSLTTAEEMKNQTKLVMQPYANWEQYLTPAPLSIAILGELVFISAKTDFSINKNSPKDGYKFIKYPDSFRACLMQVCNSGWWAFSEAHKNMDQIRLHTMNVPVYMKTAVNILFKGNDEVVNAHLPDQLENIRVIADSCLSLAEKTETRFMDVIHIIQELLEACINAEHFYGEELETIRKKLEETKLREQTAKELSERMEKAVKTMETKVQEAQQNFSQALDSMPSGWDMIAMDFVGGLADGVNTLINGLSSTMVKMTERHLESPLKACGADPVDEISIFSMSSEILKCTENILTFVQKKNIDWKQLYDQKNKATKTDFSVNQFKRLSNHLQNSPECDPKTDALQLCREGINICKELAKYAPDGKCEEAKTGKLIDKITKLAESARTFDCKSKNSTNTPSLTPKPPIMSNEEAKSEKQRPSERAAENARFRIEQNRAELDKARELYDKSVEKMEKNQKELNEILITMRNCEVKEIDFNTTIKILVKGMDAMGRVKEQWEKMVRFFQMVSSIVKTSLTRTLKDFASTSEKTQALSYNAKLFSRDLLYNQAFQATNISSLVHMIAATYTEVSEKHLMDRVSSLGKLMSMEKDKPEFEQERLKLQQSCDEAQEGVLQLVLKNKGEFEKKTDSRLDKIEKELLAILPPATPEEMKSVKSSVESGFIKDAIEDYC